MDILLPTFIALKGHAFEECIKRETFKHQGGFSHLHEAGQLTRRGSKVIPAMDAIRHTYYAGYGECHEFLEDFAKLWAKDSKSNVSEAMQSIVDDTGGYFSTFVAQNPQILSMLS